MKIIAFGHIKDGQLHIVGRPRFDQELKEHKDCDVEIEIKKKGRRSSPQNRYYWGCVVKEIRLRLKELGNDFSDDDVHEYLKNEFNGVTVVSEDAEAVKIGRSTTKLNKDEFSEYVNRCRDWAHSFLGIWIDEPNTQTSMFSS